MNYRKTTRVFFLFLFTLAIFAFNCFAQDTNSVPAPGVTPAPKSTGLGLMLKLIPLAVPVLIAVAKYFLPRVPLWLLPILAPVLGALIDFLTALATGNAANPLIGALFGSAGVGVRELLDQVKQKMQSGKASGTVALIGTLIGGSILFGTGCQWHQNKLEAGGAYAPAVITIQTNETGVVTNVVRLAAPETELYYADMAFDFVYSAVISVMQFERENRETLWAISPQIKHTLDEYRPKVVVIAKEWATARKAYLANPTPANMSTLQEVLSRMRAINAAVANVIPKK